MIFSGFPTHCKYTVPRHAYMQNTDTHIKKNLIQINLRKESNEVNIGFVSLWTGKDLEKYTLMELFIISQLCKYIYKDIFYILIMYKSLSKCKYVQLSTGASQKLAETIWLLGNWVRGSCETSWGTLGTELQSSGRAASLLSCLADFYPLKYCLYFS